MHISFEYQKEVLRSIRNKIKMYITEIYVQVFVFYIQISLFKPKKRDTCIYIKNADISI